MNVYVDTSVILRVVLGQPRAINDFEEWETAYSSELLGVESRRVIDRLRLQEALDDEGVAQAHEQLGWIEQSLGWIRITPSVLRRAGQPMATSLGTLDALHLSSALLFREQRDVALVFATHDARQGLAARANSFSVLGL